MGCRTSLFIFIAFNVFANDELFNEYNILYNDLVNFDMLGYKSSWDIENNKGINKINLSQGTLMQTYTNTNFAILGNGFFKVRLENNIIGYTRYGDFYKGFGDSESNFTLTASRYGYKLYDPIIIPNNTVELLLEGNILFALLHDGTKIETGQINIYEVDEEKLIRYKDNIFITSDNFDSQIINDSKIIRKCVEMSNVNVMETLMRMYIILCELKNYDYNFDAVDQIILMLINNIPMLNELETIKMELLNTQELLDTEDKLTETIDRIIRINGQDMNFPRTINQLYQRRTIDLFDNPL